MPFARSAKSVHASGLTASSRAAFPDSSQEATDVEWPRRNDQVAGSVRALIEELLARDQVVLVDGVDGDFLLSHPLARGFWGDVECEVDGELIRIRAVEERPGNGFAVEGFVGNPV